MKKRRHHYVWKKYLRAWATNESIWCCREGQIFKSNLKGVGQIRDFYKLNYLSADDIHTIYKLFIEPSRPDLQKLNIGWLESFDLVSQIKRLVKQKGISYSEIASILDQTVHNLEEELHTKIESDSIEHIESILSGNIEFYATDQGRLDFTYYICVQYMRTPRIKTNVQYNVQQIPYIDTDIDKIWNVLCHILATNMTFSIYNDRKSFDMILLRNQSPKELITGDQPVINTKATGVATMVPPKELEFYYPVSPKIAILISDKSKFGGLNELTLCEIDVNRYNQMMSEQSLSQIYAASREVLNEYV